jgi:hypothetical protein
MSVTLGTTKTLFPLGRFVTTPAAENLLELEGTEKGLEFGDLDYYVHRRMSELLQRHASGDDGDLCSEDKDSNVEALEHGNRIFSSYNLDTISASKVWIITEWDRSVTTFLLPEDY